MELGKRGVFLFASNKNWKIKFKKAVKNVYIETDPAVVAVLTVTTKGQKLWDDQKCMTCKVNQAAMV